MEDLIKWIIENKELVIFACFTISVSIPITMHFGKTVVNNKKVTNTTNNYNNSTKKQSQYSNVNNRNGKSKHSHKGTTKQNIELTKIQLYSTGKKGKVYTKSFYKTMNHNFGIEITLKNNTSVLQNVKVGWCIYKDGKEVLKGTFNKKVKAKDSLTTDFYVREQDFNNLKIGKYKSLFWVNDQRVQKVYFKITIK